MYLLEVYIIRQTSCGEVQKAVLSIILNLNFLDKCQIVYLYMCQENTRIPVLLSVCVCVPVQEVIAEGYSGSQTLSQLHCRLVSMESLTDKQKSIVAEKMGVRSHMQQSCTHVNVAWLTVLYEHYIYIAPSICLL